MSETQAQNRQLFKNDTFCFECHSGLECFTRCCKNADMYLYPYDIIRMKNRLSISSDEFLNKYTVSAFRDNQYFPNVMLSMSEDKDKSCPFLTPEGCTIYEDRPFSCRAYPVERAVARFCDEKGPQAGYFVAQHSYCLGHTEARKWTAEQWIKNQQIEQYNEMNDLWVETDTIFRSNPWGNKGIESPALKMSFMACYNVDSLKKFIFDSTFLSRFEIPVERIDKIQESDIELMKFGFDWVKLFLTNSGTLSAKP